MVELKKALKVCGLVLVGLVIVCICILVGLVVRDDGRIFDGVHSLGLDLGGMTLQQAEQFLRDAGKRISNAKVRIVVRTLSNGGISLAEGAPSREVKASSVGISVDPKATAKEAYEYGREGSILQRLRERWCSMRHGVEIQPKFLFNEDVAERFVSQLKRQYESRPVDANVELIGGRIRITESAYGRRVDDKATLKLWGNLVRRGQFAELPLLVETVRPSVAREDVAHINAVIGECVTRYNPAQRSRAHNISLAVSALDGKLIRAGEVFSFNETVGPRNFERGYKLAPTLVRGRFVDDVGGGVCQVAGTLFNAALLAGLEVVERHCHSRPVRYLPLGRDATVNYGSLDLKLRNPYPYPVCIKAYATRGKLKVLILGKGTGMRYVLRSEVLKVLPVTTIVRQDASVPAGKKMITQRGHCGYVVALWRLAYRDGKLVRKEVVCSTTYPPQPCIISEGSTGSASQCEREENKPSQPLHQLPSTELIDISKSVFNEGD
jgi:vancomycin resistance protein YoaR